MTNPHSPLEVPDLNVTSGMFIFKILLAAPLPLEAVALAVA